MGGKRFITRLSLEQRIARAVGFTITMRRGPSEVYRKTAANAEEARLIARRMNAGLEPDEQPATISAITPEGKTFRVPELPPEDVP